MKNLHEYKALFRMKALFEAVPIAWERARVGAVSENDAVRTLLAAMDAHGRRPPPQDVVAFGQAAPELGPLAVLVVVFVVWRWYRTTTPLVGLAQMVAMSAAVTADSEPGRTSAVR